MEELIKILQSKNIHPSHQRIKILEILEKNKDHMNVNMIYDELLKEIPTISKTTVYNTLSAFAEKGLVHCLTITPEEMRYDYKTKPHHHLLCTRCGRIIDVDVQCPYADTMEIDGHSIEEIQGYFKGTCKECLSRDKAQTLK
jgi:Fe2+ or Zn2+ uptake regulation protein